MVESSDKMWSTGEGNGKPLQYSCLENPKNNMKSQKDRKLKDELPRWVGAQYATEELWMEGCNAVQEVLKARILKSFAIPFSSGPHFVRTLHHDPFVLGGPTWHGLVSLS